EVGKALKRPVFTTFDLRSKAWAPKGVVHLGSTARSAAQTVFQRFVMYIKIVTPQGSTAAFGLALFAKQKAGFSERKTGETLSKEKVIVTSTDEKTSIQAIEHTLAPKKFETTFF